MPLSPAARQVTLRQLATHTSGFPRIPAKLGAQATALAHGDEPLLDPYSYMGPQYVFDCLATTEDQRPPGRFEYSNFGMGLLGHVLEKVTGQDYETLVTDKILAPLGMTATGVTLRPEMQAHLAPGHTAQGTPARPWRFAALHGAGALSANVRDMLRFIQANVEEDGQPLHAGFKKMHEPQFNGHTGIGWMRPTWLDRLCGNTQVVWHNGMVGGYASYLCVDAKARIGVVILTNKAIGPEVLGTMLMRQVRTQSWTPWQR
jgi:CubicO group peptidase (beta-lactamase class C family)